MTRMRRLLATAILALTVASTAQASYLESSISKFARYVRAQSSFVIEHPTCVPDEYGLLPSQCQEGDLAFRVQRRTPSGSWRGVYSESTPVFTDSFSSTAGTDTTRLYYFLFRGSRYYCGSLRRYRLFVTFVDQFLDTPNSRNVHYFRSCR